MRRLGVLGVCLILVGACGGSSGGDTSAPTTSTSLDPTTSLPSLTTTSAELSSTTSIPVTTTTRHDPSGDHQVLVVNRGGVFQMDTSGTITQLVTGGVAYAVDDTRGGLLFQIARGRWLDAYAERSPPGRWTVVWWIPAGSSAPQELLVSAPGEGHYLSLHDAFVTGDSFDSESADADMADTLRVYDAATGAVKEIYRTRGYEWNLVDVTAAGGLVSATEVQILGAGCRLLHATTGEFVTRPGFPSATAACFDETTDCVVSCALSPDAGQVAYDWTRSGEDGRVQWEISVSEVTAGAEVARLVVPVVGRWGPAELDVDGDLVLLNRAWEGLYEEPALLAYIGDPNAAPTELAIPGRARFATRPVDIAAPVPVPWSITTLQGDGLGLIQFGDPETEVLELFERLFGSPPTDPGDEAGWVEYVGWEDLGLFLGFSRPEWSDYDGVYRFIGWQYRGGTVELDLRTASGVGVGTTTAELRVIYGDDLVVPTEPDVCAGLAVRLLGRDEGVVAHLHESGVVSAIWAGSQVGC